MKITENSSVKIEKSRKFDPAYEGKNIFFQNYEYLFISA